MKPKRILFLTGSLNMGGTERNILHLAARMDKQQFTVEVRSDYEGEILQTELRKMGITCGALKGAPSLGKGLFTRLFKHNLPYQWRLFKRLRKYRHDVVHAFGFPMAYYAVLLGRLAGCRRIVFAVQDWDVWKRSRIYRFLDWLCSRLAWRVIADGEGARRMAISRQGMSGQKIITIYDGVNTEELQPQKTVAETRQELGLQGTGPVVGMIARLDIPKKGQDIFLVAAEPITRAHPEAQLLLVGGGPDQEKIERLIADLPKSARPVPAGFRNDLGDVLRALDILVIASRWESVPKILLEAMSLGKPVVATRVGDIEEILDETCGVLIDADNADALAQAVCSLLANPERRQILGETARKRIDERNLTLDASVKQYEQLYKKAT